MTLSEQQRNRRTNEIKQTILSDTNAYIESIGKVDAHNLVDIVDKPDAGSTVLRIVMGATSVMPFRALSYVDSALRAARLIPSSQVQIVHAHHLGNRVNAIDLSESHQQAQLLAKRVVNHLKHFPELEGRVLHASDTAMDTDQYVDVVHAIFERDKAVASKLLAKGSKHGGDAIRYVAAHYAFQDTNDLELDAFDKSAPSQMPADRIVSIGCGQERLFYQARMGMRALLQSSVVTAQLFTRHVTPPYYLARDGEPSLEETSHTPAMDTITDSSARRDIQHFLNVTSIHKGDTL